MVRLPVPGEPDAGTAPAVLCDGGAPVDDAPFPPDGDDVDEAVWAHEIRDAADRLVLEPSSESASLPAAELSFTLRNGTDRTFETNYWGWAIYRREDGRWHRVAPTSWPTPLMRLRPGDSHEWTVRVANDDLSGQTFHVEGLASLPLCALGGGTYAFAIDGWWEDQDATPTYEHRTMRAALFGLDGDPLPLEPSGGVTDVRREGDRVVVSATNESAAQAGGDRPATYTLTHDDAVTDPRHLVTERVYREWPLRDALAHVEQDVTAVRVETTTVADPPFGVLGDLSPLAYAGQTYRIDVEDGSE